VHENASKPKATSPELHINRLGNSKNDKVSSLKGTIQVLNNKGEGIVNMVEDSTMSYRIPNTLEGEIVLFQKSSNKDTTTTTATTATARRSKIQLDASLIRILEASVDRVTPSCPIASSCGGCVFQHQNYSAHFR
jgi:tRNA/tmRNA/rRNA uracil-C5-methylase (TrmA/RlmC/RlmD family)